MRERSIVVGSYNHLPEGSPGALFEETYQVSWRPFLSTLYKFPDLAVTVHYSGTVLRWLQASHPEFIMLLEEMVTRKQVEVLGGGFFSPIMPVIPSSDRVGQLELLTTYIRKLFGRRPRGAWAHEFGWEPSLVSSYQACGFDYTFLPAQLFEASGLDPSRPAMTEDQGKILCVFPVHGFDAPPRGDGDIMAAIREALGSVTDPAPLSFFLSDAAIREHWEKSGLESPDLLLETFFAGLLREEAGLETTTPGRWLKGAGVSQHGYFPSSGSNLLAARSGAPLKGTQCRPTQMTPRRLLLRYPESYALYSKMHYVRILVSQLRGDKSRKKSALEELWRGQCGDAYWQGSGGGILSMPIRAAAWSALIEAEKMTRQKGSFVPGIIRADLDLDGEKEILFQGVDYNAHVGLSDAALAEFDSFRSLTNYVNAMDQEDREARLRSFMDRLGARGSFSEGSRNDGWRSYALVEGGKPSMTAVFSGKVGSRIKGEARELEVEKTFSFRRENLGVSWMLSNRCGFDLRLRFTTELNLSPAVSPDQVGVRLGARGPELAAGNGAALDATEVTALAVENRAALERLEFRSDTAFSARIEALHLDAEILGRTSRLWQGQRISFGWDLDLKAGASEILSLTLELSRM